jgi:hypothetical protein
MALRRLYEPLHPDLDGFLFAAVGEERNGIPLSMMSALTQLGLDPWDEAGRLSSLATRDAVECLTALLMRLPGAGWPCSEARQIADGLIELLPKRLSTASSVVVQGLGRQKIAPGKTFWLVCFLLGLAVIISAVIKYGGFPSGN